MPKQRLLQKVFMLPLLVAFLVLSTLVITPTASADDYPVPANGQCNANDAKVTANGEEMCRTATQTTAPAGDQSKTDADDGVTCAIEKIGWILCPIIEISGTVGDKAFQFLSKTFLETQPELIGNNENSGTRVAWETARNLANIMFIVAFLIIIYSQVTGAGITNYGIKKMLPRLIVAAIAVNASYYICQIAVDLTNIAGYELQNFLVNAAKSVTANTVMPIATDGTSFTQDSGMLSKIAIGVLAIGAIVYFLLPVLGAVIMLVVITCLSIITILLLRKALIVLLIVIAPMAFVLYLLPNTEKYFQKWLTMFWKLLLVFPVVGLLMGSGQLASSIILAAGVQSPEYKDNNQKCLTLPQYSNTNKGDTSVTGSGSVGACTPGAVPFMLGLTAAGIAVLPLIAVWSVLKSALGAAGAIGGKIGATVNGWNSGSKGRVQKGRAENSEYRRNRRDALALQGGLVGGTINAATLGGARRGATRRARQRIAKEELNRAEIDHVAGSAVDQNGDLTFAGRRMAGLLSNQDTRQRVAANAVNAQRKLQEDANKAAHNQVDRLDTTSTPGTNDGGVAGRQAAQLVASGDFDSPHLAAILEHLSKTNQQAFMHLATQISASANGRTSNATVTASNIMSGMGLYGGGNVAAMRNGQSINLRDTAVSNLESGGISPADLAGMGNEALRTIDAITTGNALARGEVAAARGRMTAEQQNNLSGEKLTILSGF